MIGPLMQVNVGSPHAILLGFINFGLALIYLVSSMTQVIETLKSQAPPFVIAIRITQMLLAPLLLLFCGVIIVLNGWRLDPVLALNQFMMQLLIGYLAILELRRTIKKGQLRKTSRI